MDIHELYTFYRFCEMLNIFNKMIKGISYNITLIILKDLIYLF
jgi:hypothetical protein